MDVERINTVEEFLERSLELRTREPVRTNVISSVATSVARQETNYDECFWWVVTRGDEPVGVAMRTGPHGVVLGPMDDEVASCLGTAVAGVDRTFPNAAGAIDTVSAFLDATSRAGDPRRRHEARREVLYEIDELEAPSVAGAFRPAEAADAELVAAWARLFHAEALSPNDPPIEGSVRARITKGQVFLWEHAGDVVAMAAHADAVRSGHLDLARIGPVFTPLEHRRRGYGAAVTAQLTELLIAEGCHVMLYADKANATSNGVYQRLGYVALDEVVRFDLT